MNNKCVHVQWICPFLNTNFVWVICFFVLPFGLFFSHFRVSSISAVLGVFVAIFLRNSFCRNVGRPRNELMGIVFFLQRVSNVWVQVRSMKCFSSAKIMASLVKTFSRFGVISRRGGRTFFRIRFLW